MKVCAGGTFNTFHAGHKKLLDTAISLSDKIVVGVTSDDYVKKHKKKKKHKPYEERAAQIQEYVGDRGDIVPLDDEFGPAGTDADMKAIVTSVETYPRALEINTHREKEGLKPLIIVTIPMVKV